MKFIQELFCFCAILATPYVRDILSVYSAKPLNPGKEASSAEINFQLNFMLLWGVISAHDISMILQFKADFFGLFSGVSSKKFDIALYLGRIKNDLFLK